MLATEGVLRSSTLSIDPVVVQNMGVRVHEVLMGEVFRNIEALGNIDIPEPNISVINLKYSGWIRKLWADKTGQQIKKGERLFSIHAPELILAQEEYLLAVNEQSYELKKSAEDKLAFLGLSKNDISALAKKKSVDDETIIYSPQDGFVIHKAITEGAKVNAGADLFKIGNYNKIWVNARVYEFDAPYVKLGTPAVMELSYIKGHSYDGVLSFINPSLDEKTRTLNVRLEFENPDLFLRPNMFASVKIKSQVKKNVLVVPSEAVLHRAAKTFVFVAKALGKYEPREIKIGLVGSNDKTEVISGLKLGEQVVSSGQFLLDSESQSQEAVAKMLDHNLHSLKPESKPKLDNNMEMEVYWTCPMHSQIIRDEAGKCPICGMDLVKKTRLK